MQVLIETCLFLEVLFVCVFNCLCGDQKSDIFYKIECSFWKNGMGVYRYNEEVVFLGNELT